MKAAFKLVCFVGIGLGLWANESYLERYRPRIHFSPAKNWTNDPCGLVYALGQYHLFFQHNPSANVWGNMSWGHATSSDLVHWKQLPVAISADARAAIFTGSSVVDEKNVSRLCASRNRSCIVSIYTGFIPKTSKSPEKQTQNIAFSQDGLVWTKYSGNPVLDLGRSDTRDPKVFWYEPTKRWILVIVQATDHKIRIFGSQDLKQWRHLSDFGPEGGTGGVWECPDLIKLPVAGQPGQTRWLLKIGLNPGHIAGGSGEQYFVGQFDGTRFKNDNSPQDIRWVDYGRDCYCALTFNNQPHSDAPRMIGWMNNWQYAADVPTSPWRGSMTLPRVLGLSSENGTIALVQNPVDDLHSLRGAAFEYRGTDAADLNAKLAQRPHRSEAFELLATVRLGTAKHFAWRLFEGNGHSVLLAYDAVRGELSVDRSQSGGPKFSNAFPSRAVAPLKLKDETLDLHVFVDSSSLEVFSQHGKVVMTNLVFPSSAGTGISLVLTEGVGLIDVKLWELKSIWSAPHA